MFFSHWLPFQDVLDGQVTIIDVFPGCGAGGYGYGGGCGGAGCGGAVGANVGYGGYVG